MSWMIWTVKQMSGRFLDLRGIRIRLRMSEKVGVKSAENP